MSKQFKLEIREALLLARPNLKEKSLISYVSTLSNIPKKMGYEEPGIEFFADYVDEILEYLDEKNPSQRKSVLSPLVVLTNLDKYKELMSTDIQVHDEHEDKQIMNPKQEKNWISWPDIVAFYKTLENKAKYSMKTKENDMTLLKQYVLTSMYIHFPPRRIMDYASFKIRNYEADVDNYVNLKKGVIVFNKYKTVSKYGRQEFKINKELKAILTAWSKINDKDYLLEEEKTIQQVTQMLQKTFGPTGKSVSANQLRHSYITDHYGSLTSMPSILEMEDLSLKMGHSQETAMKYIKKVQEK